MAVLWFTEVPDNSFPLDEIWESETKWEVGVGEDDGQVGISIQSTKMSTATVINVTPQLDDLIDALVSARKRIGR